MIFAHATAVVQNPSVQVEASIEVSDDETFGMSGLPRVGKGRLEDDDAFQLWTFPRYRSADLFEVQPQQ